MSTSLTSNDFLNDLLTYFQDQCLAGLNYLLPEALFLVWVLGIILICLQMVTQGQIFGSGSWQKTVITVLKIGAFIFLVTNWEEISIHLIFKSFEVAGPVASNYSQAVRPSEILMHGFVLTKEVLAGVWTAALTGSFFLMLVKLAMCLAIIAAFAYIAITVFLVNIEFYLTAALSVILLPFGMIPYLKFLFDNVVSAMFSFGAKYMVITFLLGLGSAIFSSWNTALGADTPPLDLVKAVVGVAVWCIMCLQIPGLVSGMIYGAPSYDSGAPMAAAAAGGAAAGTARTAWGATRGMRQSTWTMTKQGGRAAMGKAGSYTARSLRSIGTMFRQ
ncbi:MAG: type IV secretion system protein [Negativicutes bacterium]|nr:type IV secretion system protein [Negativicutes bacterium]